jgi:hypothetical protein
MAQNAFPSAEVPRYLSWRDPFLPLIEGRYPDHDIDFVRHYNADIDCKD